MTEQNSYVQSDLRSVQTWLCSCAPGSRSPDMSLTPDHTWGKSVITVQAGGLWVGLKSNIRCTSKDNFQYTLVSSAAAQVNHPHNTSLTSKLSGQNKMAGVICSENVFTWYLTYRRNLILMWNIGYFLSYINKRQNMVLLFIGHSYFRD